MESFEPGRVSETKAWLHKAALDLRGVQVDRSADPPLLEDALFHSQQLAEKSLKAFLCWHDIPFRKTHNLVELGEDCVQLDPTLEPHLQKAVILTKYAWKFRYPGDVEEVEEAEADKALHLASKVFEEIKKRLPREVHPDYPGGGEAKYELHEAPAAYGARRQNAKKPHGVSPKRKSNPKAAKRRAKKRGRK